MSRERNNMGEQRNKKVSEEEALAEAEKALNALKEKSVDGAKKTDKEEKGDKEKAGKKPVVQKALKKTKKAKVRSKKYQESLKLVDKNKFYPIAEALDLVKKLTYTKFNSSVEVHIRLSMEKGKAAVLRGLLQLPHSTGKEPKVGIVDEALIGKIIQDKKTEFDILIAKPEMMPKLARLAKILGPQGKMPNPKSGTVTNDPQKVQAEIAAGRVEYKTDNTGIIHLIIGKVKDDDKKLLENYQAVMATIPVNKLQRVHICATMSPSVKVKI
ncbi:MAG: 50S ribosomal protein L1 [Patescibacteria group bacterium]|nr:50S ribosomal protein L1 [Patescibacteria group bacterium]